MHPVDFQKPEYVPDQEPLDFEQNKNRLEHHTQQ